MNKLSLISTVGVAAAVIPGLSEAKAAASAEKKPLNVILIMTDDQGYGDVGYTGNPNINTPELDKLCSESICFDNFHTG
ncbi:MAG: sulfatase-like hydrolase/transferase, partial [Rikenellaceae bacterium]